MYNLQTEAMPFSSSITISTTGMLEDMEQVGNWEAHLCIDKTSYPAGMRPPPGLEFMVGEPRLPSVGSAKHAGGNCSPCYFFNHSRGCKASGECDFCHMTHQNFGPARPSKVKRAKAKRIAAELVNGVQAGKSVNPIDALAPEVGQKAYLEEIIGAKLKELDRQYPEQENFQ